jgi:DUF2075 family protein/SOS-response transcriptional repressor LexA
MIAYESDVKGFRADVLSNRIEEEIHRRFRETFGHRTSDSEVRAWKNSLGYMDRVLAHTAIPEDCGVAVEFRIPGTASRIDFVLTGLASDKRKVALIVELKQWDSVTPTAKDGIVETFLGGGVREANHPSYQAWSYATLLEDFNEAVRAGPIELRPCAYLHNCESGDVIRAPFYRSYTSKAPAFVRDDADKLRDFIVEHVRYGDRRAVLYEILNGRIRPSKNLADHLASLLKGNSEFKLIDDQKLVYETAIAMAKKAQSGGKQVLIVEGGPGTGKSVVAINLLVRLTEGHLNARYITKNRAPRSVYESRLTGTLKKNRISNLFGGPDKMLSAEPNTFDALIVDEAHRLREKSGMFGNLGENQLKELIQASRFTVFFVDDAQRVTLKDIGGVAEIERWSTALGAKCVRMQLASQFRCNGSDGYLAWIDHTLGIRETANTTLENINYDFRVCGSANEVRDLIRSLNRTNNKARMVAGYCWQWKSKKDEKPMDIVLPDEGFAAQWNFDRDGGTWIIRADSVEQVGCIHTCQGLELDYVGVLLGHDMVVRNGSWLYYPERRAKGDSSIRGHAKLLLNDRLNGERLIRDVIRNTYRTLMTRGARGCFVYSVDPETNAFLRRSMGRKAASESPGSVPADTSVMATLPFRVLSAQEAEHTSNRVRYFPNMEAAAGGFSQTQLEENALWAEISNAFRVTPGMFVLKVVGESMNRVIPNGSWVLFKPSPAGSRDGKIVLVKTNRASDPENGTHLTVKRYRSTKHREGESWRHATIALWPESNDRSFTPITVGSSEDDGFEVIGEFLAILAG